MKEYYGVPLIEEEYNILNDLEEKIGGIILKEWKEVSFPTFFTYPKMFEAEEGKVISLTLFHGREYNLKVFPKEVYNLPHLKRLEIDVDYEGGIETLPDDIYRLDSLEELILRGDNLKSIPKSIGNLISLQNLYIGCRRLVLLNLLGN